MKSEWRFAADSRGASILLGLVLMLGVLILFAAVMQAYVVPAETEAAEADHSSAIQSEMVGLGAAIDRSAATGGERVQTLPLGPQYTDRPFLLSPSAGSGSISTEPGTIRLENAGFEAPFSNEAQFRADNPEVATNRVVYRPNYHEFEGGATVAYEHGIVGAAFEEGQHRLRDARFVDGDSIHLTAVSGEFSRTDHTSAVPVRPTSGPTRSVDVESYSGDPLTLRIPTELDENVWEAALAGEPATLTEHDGSTAVVTFDPGTYELRMGGVSLDDDRREAAAYLVNVTDEEYTRGERMTVEARDRYDNPVADTELTVDAPPECDIGPLRTDESGQASFQCDEPGIVTVTLSTATDQPENYETVAFSTGERSEQPRIGSLGAFDTARTFDAGGEDRKPQVQVRVNYTASDAVGQLDTASVAIRDDDGTVTADTQDIEGFDDIGVWETPWLDPGGGEYEAVVRVRDATGETDTQTVPVGEVRETLRADAGDDRSAAVGDELQFDGGDSTGNIVRYQWEFGDGTTARGETVSHTYREPGTYTVQLTVTDERGNTDTDTATVTITDTLAADAGPDRVVERGETVEFDGSGSRGDIVSYEWDFGDGSTAIGERVSHSYAQTGTYTVRLTVTDRQGRTATDTATVEVRETVPLAANAGPDKTTEIGQAIQFDGRGSTGDIVAYEWEFGDGTTATGATPIHTYRNPGTYTVRLTVRSADGRTASDTATVTVFDAPPTANAGPDRTVQVGQSLTFDGGGSTGDIVSYQWDFDDGTTASGQTVSKTYNTADTYTVTLTVTDRQGRTSTDQATVRVQPQPVALTAEAGDDRTATPGQVLQFDGRGSTGDIVRYGWEFGDGTTATGATPQHAYSETGTYTVRLTVTDAQGRTASDTLIVSVIREEPADPLVYVSGSARAGGQALDDLSGVQLGLRNTGSLDVTITRIHARSATATTRNPDRIQFGSQRTGIWRDEVYVDGNRQAGRFKGRVDIGTATANEIGLAQNARLSGGTTAQTYFYQFRPPGNGLNMQGGTISLTVTYQVGGQTRQLRIDNVRIQ